MRLPRSRYRIFTALTASLVFACSGAGNTTASSSASSSAASSSSGGGGPADAGTGGHGGMAPTCPVCSTPVEKGTLSSNALNEVSGIAASRVYQDVWYVHNDSGDSARFFALSGAGQLLATFTVQGASAVDWEDIAVGPCSPGSQVSCVFLADIGDNSTVRTSYAIYRVPEPASIADATVTADAIPFNYPDTPHNAETLIVHPTSGVISIVTKVFAGPSFVFDFPAQLTPGVMVTPVKSGEVKPPDGSALVTGGDIHPGGHSVILRTYTNLWVYPMKPGEGAAAALARPPCLVPVADEGQGEAVGFNAAEAAYRTVSEGTSKPIFEVACTGL